MDKSIKPAIVKGTKSQSVLFDSCNLAKELEKLENKWVVVGKVWVELLSWAACQCRPKPHLRLLGRAYHVFFIYNVGHCNINTGFNGELITYIWLLMAAFGIGEHLYVIDQGYYAIAKLIAHP